MLANLSHGFDTTVFGKVTIRHGEEEKETRFIQIGQAVVIVVVVVVALHSQLCGLQSIQLTQHIDTRFFVQFSRRASLGGE